MRHRTVAFLFTTVLLGLVVASGAGVALPTESAVTTEQPAQAESTVDLVESCAETPSPDFDDPEDGNAAIGWVDGYWYDEPLGFDLNTSDGLSETQLEALTARTAARFEALRCLAIDEVPPIEVMTRDELRSQFEENPDAIGEDARSFDNAKFETLLIAGSDEDTIETRTDLDSDGLGGYYVPEENQIVIITDDDDGIPIHEGVLAHELGHAIQDHHFNLTDLLTDYQTHDGMSAALGLIEGDVSHVQFTYETACAEERWNEPCYLPTGPATDVSDEINWGLVRMAQHPYDDGPAFVDYFYDRGGWEAVDELYENPPETTTEIIDPERYGTVETATLEVEDESTDEWERIVLDGEAYYNLTSQRGEYTTVGQAGLTSMFIAPTDETGLEIVLSPLEAVNLNENGEPDMFDLYDYDQPETDGWRGDRLSVYQNGDGQSASVWHLAWADVTEVEQFVDAYETLIEYRGGAALESDGIDEHNDVYVFDESDFDMVLALETAGETVTIVTAPSVDELPEVHGRLELEGDSDDEAGAEDGNDGENETDSSDENEASDDDDERTDSSVDDSLSEDDGLPGFDIAVAICALLIVTLMMRRR